MTWPAIEPESKLGKGEQVVRASSMFTKGGKGGSRRGSQAPA